jgi:hypothetical protein
MGLGATRLAVEFTISAGMSLAVTIALPTSTRPPGPPTQSQRSTGSSEVLGRETASVSMRPRRDHTPAEAARLSVLHDR